MKAEVLADQSAAAQRSFQRISVVLSFCAAAALLQLGFKVVRGGSISAISTDLDLLMLVIAGLALGLAFYNESIRDRILRTDLIERIPRLLVASAYLLLAMLLPAVVLAGLDSGIPLLFARLMLFGWICVFAAVALRSLTPTLSWNRALASTVLAFAVVYRIALFLPGISSYMFSLGWSEASRYFYASLFFSEKIYGVGAAPSVLHPTRYLLQSIPFIIPQLSLSAHRIWQLILWLVMPTLTMFLLVRRLKLRSRWLTAMVMLWGLLFLFQGPILYHLFGSAIPVLLGFSTRRPWRSLLVVVIGSLWAGISRINWFPVPGLLAAALYILEARHEPGHGLKTIIKPLLYFSVGIGSAFAAQSIYVLLSGNELGQFTSSFSSSLLWYRLLPNPTYRIGMLLGIGLAAGPLLAILAARKSVVRAQIPTKGLIVLALILMAFLAGGMVVSVKIGGGSNLHNFDAFLLMLLVIGLSILSQRYRTEELGLSLGWREAVGLLVIPVGFALSQGGSVPDRDRQFAQQVLHEIQDAVDASTGGEVLFIAERHLLTFGYVQGATLIPQFEKVFLMEMAMSENEGYLHDLRAGLAAHDFSVIISDPLKIQYQGRERAFGEENDAWVRNVSAPILCHYEAVFESSDPPVQILLPKREDSEC
jgi:hypothetical protein